MSYARWEMETEGKLLYRVSTPLMSDTLHWQLVSVFVARSIVSPPSEGWGVHKMLDSMAYTILP